MWRISILSVPDSTQCAHFFPDKNQITVGNPERNFVVL